ncbi:MAG: thioredoxin [Candidatus Sumerlaeota bacterium]|nr:thioredoxin [Candidatus Sumerlaeota bacterium]
MAGNVLEVNEASFQTEVVKNAGTTLIDFWAPWCGPCRQVAPVVEGLAGEYAGKLKVVKVNVDDSPNVAANYGIQSIPTLLFVKNGQEVDRIIGAVMKQTIKDAIDRHV